MIRRQCVRDNREITATLQIQHIRSPIWNPGFSWKEPLRRQAGLRRTGCFQLVVHGPVHGRDSDKTDHRYIAFSLPHVTVLAGTYGGQPGSEKAPIFNSPVKAGEFPATV